MGVSVTQVGSPSVSAMKATAAASPSNGHQNQPAQVVPQNAQEATASSNTGTMNNPAAPTKPQAVSDASAVDSGMKGLVDLGVMGQYYDGKPIDLVRLGVDPETGENLDRRTAYSVVGGLFGSAIGGEILGPILGKLSTLFGRTADSVGAAAVGDGGEAATLFHYTGQANVAGILERGLVPGASGKIFTTPNGGLTPLQAQIELALSPNRGLPSAMLEIDAAGLRAAGIKPSLGPLRVQPTSTAPGGGIESIFDQQIPPEFIKRP